MTSIETLHITIVVENLRRISKVTVAVLLISEFNTIAVIKIVVAMVTGFSSFLYCDTQRDYVEAVR